jgi:hypothetical protein
VHALAIRSREGAGPRRVGTARALLAFGVFLLAGVARAEERSVTIFEGRKISVSVPTGWKFGEAQDPKTGVQTLEWLEPSGEVQLDISFLPDSKGRMATREALEAEMKRTLSFYLTDAVEREMRFTSLETADGVCEYTSFTDRRLVGRKIPEGERLISTTGMRSWKGVYLLFTLLSNSRDTEAFRQAIEIVRTGVKEVGGQGVAGAPASGAISVTLPFAPWVMKVPGEGAKVAERTIKPDGRSGYFLLRNDASGLNVSFFIEPARKCTSSRECRDMVQKAGFAHLGRAEKITPSEIGDISVVECFVPDFRGMPVQQQHLFAEFVVQGYWVDMHVSKVLYTPADRERFEQLVKGISFRSKGSLD